MVNKTLLACSSANIVHSWARDEFESKLVPFIYASVTGISHTNISFVVLVLVVAVFVFIIVVVAYYINRAYAGSIGRLSVTNVVQAANLKAQFHPNEPDKPSVKTAIPGPKSLERIAELSRIQVNLPCPDRSHVKVNSLLRFAHESALLLLQQVA